MYHRDPEETPSTILSPTPVAQRSGFMYENNAGAQGKSNLSNQSQGQMGTQIDDKGVVTVNIIVDDPSIPFLAVRDTVRFLQSLYPGWSLPAFVGGGAIPNEVGATYSLEIAEKKVIDSYDGEQKEEKIRRKLTIYIREILNERTVKRIKFEVKERLTAEVYTHAFPTTTYIVCEALPFNREPGKFHFTVTFDGGPQLVEHNGCCCFGDPNALRAEEAAEEMKPRIYQQADSMIQYIRHFNPNDPLARQIASHNEMFRSSFEDESTFAGSNSKISGNSARSPKLAQMGRQNSKDMYQSVVSSKTSSADEIKKLYELFQAGALTKNEFEMEKRKLLGGNSSQVSSRRNGPPPSLVGDNFF